MAVWIVMFMFFFFFFFNDTATTEIYTLSLHDALPIWSSFWCRGTMTPNQSWPRLPDRKSTRLNSSHDQISYAVFCLKKKTHERGRQPSPQAPPRRVGSVRPPPRR